jgi:hypothetical protein
MKKIILLVTLMQILGAPLIAQDKDSVVVLPEVIVSSTFKINEQVNRSFDDKFPDAYNVVWTKLNKDYLTRFMQVDVKHQALYRKNGVLKYDIIYMGESHIPKKIADLISNAYGAYDVTNAARIDRAGQVFWIVNLEGAHSYKVIRVDDNGDMEEVKHYIKS